MDNPSHLESQSGPHDAANPNQGAGTIVTTVPSFIDRLYTALKKSLGALSDNTSEDPQHNIPRYITKVTAHSRGYPRLAALATVDDEYLIFRQFRYLRVRVLLDLQARLQAYEKDLKEYDRINRHNPRPIQQTELLTNIEETIKRYRAMMDCVSSPQRQPPETTIEALIKFFRKHGPVTKEEDEYYLYQGDLVSLKPHGETARVDNFLTALLYNNPHKLIKKAFGDEERTRQNGGVTVLSPEKIGATGEAILVLVIILIYMLPIWPLYLLCQRDITTLTLSSLMLILFGSTGAFIYSLKYITRLKRQELFAYSTGYVAILAAFISQTLQNKKS
ncbi:uncharacterized protein F4812DRAFT_446106 [Daldinia caldariorum]|uniref:uncharacterized protein n=1 Tax=Daldinia caldariorum TaxID=326644 RepID=UPI0020087D0E|nr:uncharacterized protein F4812DRAFT_446106 [Daldinia caldariorum]KAI1463719.1 hypothetical protein F4812DRAFT_446106 [Daldinia caldariorum]